MEKAIHILNELQRQGIIGRYAIGGAMGAMFYAEPVVTFDLDVFVDLPISSAGLITLAPLYDALRERGYKVDGECVNVEGVPMQFLPPPNALVDEAMSEAQEIPYGSAILRVMRPEHLVGIALQTGRNKDRQRVRMLAETQLDDSLLSRVLCEYDLEERWIEWTR